MKVREISKLEISHSASVLKKTSPWWSVQAFTRCSHQANERFYDSGSSPDSGLANNPTANSENGCAQYWIASNEGGIGEFGAAKAYFGLGEGGIGGSYVSMEYLTVIDRHGSMFRWILVLPNICVHLCLSCQRLLNHTNMHTMSSTNIATSGEDQ